MSSRRPPLHSSRRRFLYRLGAAALALAAAGRAPTPASAGDTSQAGNPVSPATETRRKPPLNTPMRPRMAPDVALDVKIGQMLLLGIHGTAVPGNASIATAVRDEKIGNAVLFTGNVRSKAQLLQLTGDMQAMAPLPLLIALDQEGGQIVRLTPQRGFPATVSHAELGKLNDPAETRARARAMAETLAEVGVNLNLAPVVDVAVNPQNPIISAYGRSFSADPEVVAAQAEAFIDGHHDAGIQCTLKHFPGHGSSRSDTHLGFVDVSDSWSDAELIPYRRLIEAGKVDAIMTAHIFNRNLDPELPSTLSPAVVTGLLREQLGYDGVVISDDLQMRAISDLFRLDRAIELAILAGVDIMAIGQNLIYQGTAAQVFLKTVHRMLEAGSITEARIDESYRRVARLKGLEG